MNYDFSQKYRIKIEGTPQEIKGWVEEICNFMDGGASLSMVKDDLNNLEKIVDAVPYTFGTPHRIYFNHNSLLYVPAVSGNEGKKFHFGIFKKLFDESKKKMDEKYKQ